MKKTLLLSLCLALVMVFVACGSNTTSSAPAVQTTAAPAVQTTTAPDTNKTAEAPVQTTTTQEPVKETWKPTKPITLWQVNSAGGSGDLEIKAMQAQLEKELGVSIVCEYNTVGSGIACTEDLYVSAPDGYTIYYLNAPAIMIQQKTNDVNYDVADLTYLCNVSTEYRCLAVLADSPIKSVDDVIADSKAGNLHTVAHSGNGSSGHLQILMLEEAMGVSFQPVPFAGNSAAKAAFLGGHVDLWAIDASSCYALVNDGTIRVLAVCAPERLERMPDVPTFAELGYDVISYTSRGFIAPPNTPEEIADYLMQAIYNAVTGSDMAEYAERVGTNLNPILGEEYRKASLEILEYVDSVKGLFE